LVSSRSSTLNSLSGSFSGQVKKSVKLLETHLKAIRNKSDPGTIKQIEASLEQLRAKLEVLEVRQLRFRRKYPCPPSTTWARKLKLSDFLGLL